MSTYKMEDGVVVNTDLAIEYWGDDSDWDGSNWISKATGSQWHNERLYKSRKGNYYVESLSRESGVLNSAYRVSKKAAAAWIVAQAGEIPEDLKEAELEAVE